MHVLIYYDQLQEDYFHKLKGYYPNMIEIKDTYTLQQAFHESHHPILVIISQPTKRFMETLLSKKWFRIISFIGIRDVNPGRLSCVYFENEMAFKTKMDLALVDQNTERLRSYIDQFNDLDDEDLSYLEEISGFTVNKSQRSKPPIKRMTKRKVAMKKGLITVMGNPEIASDIAKSIARHSKGKVLMIDGDLMKPSLDQHFGINKLQTSIKSHMIGIDNTGINIALDTMVKGFDLGQGINAFTKYGGKNLRVMLGNYNLYNYEHYDEKQVRLLISRLHDYFQTIILSVGENPYDSMTMLGLHISGINIITCQKSVADIRFKYGLMEILAVKQGLPSSKNLIMTYEGQDQLKSVGPSVIRHLFKKSYIGHYNQKQMTNLKCLEKISERMTLWD